MSDEEFEAAVLELRQGNNKNLMKFGALMALLLIAFFVIVAVSFTVSSYVQASF